MSARFVAGGMLREQGRHADGLSTKFFPYQMVAAGSFVALVEKQVDGLQHTINTRRQLRSGWNLERNLLLSNFLARAHQALRDSSLRSQESGGNFKRAECAERFQREGGLGVLRDLRVTT